MATELINPCGIFGREDAPLAERKGLVDGATIGLFSNLKNNATLFLENIGEGLAAKYDGLEFVRFEKMASEPGEFTEEFLEKSDFVVAAFAD